MRYGVTMFATDLAMPVDDLAVEAEARGFDAFYLPEHTHIPVSRLTAMPFGSAVSLTRPLPDPIFPRQAETDQLSNPGECPGGRTMGEYLQQQRKLRVTTPLGENEL